MTKSGKVNQERIGIVSIMDNDLNYTSTEVL